MYSTLHLLKNLTCKDVQSKRIRSVRCHFPFITKASTSGSDENNVHLYNIILKESNKLLCSFKGDVFMIFDSSVINLCVHYFLNTLTNRYILRQVFILIEAAF